MRYHSSILHSVFHVIKQYGPLYPKEIVDRTGLVKSTISIALQNLVSLKLINEEESLTKRKRFRISDERGEIVAIYIGLTCINIALCDLNTNILEQKEFPVDFNSRHPQDIFKLLNETIDEWKKDSWTLLGIGVGLPRIVDYKNQQCISPAKMPEWNTFSIAHELEKRYECPVLIDNDVNMLALGEQKRGLGQGVKDFLYLKLGTGIGAGIVIDNKLFRGSLGAAGDIGHIKILGKDTPCPCGNVGCLEALAGARGIKNQAIHLKAKSSFLSKFSDEQIDFALVGQGFLEGDVVCANIIVESGYLIGGVLASISHILNPSLIIIGGRVSQIGQKLVSSIQEVFYRDAQPLVTQYVSIRRSTLLEEGGVIGAATLISDYIFESILKEVR